LETSTPTAPEAAAPPRNPTMPESTNPFYWDGRKDSVYLHVARLVCKRFGGGPKAVLDVGSNGTPTLEWHRGTAQRLVSVDLGTPYRAPGIESRVQNFFEYVPDAPFDLATCFQVLEHVPDPAVFARKLLAAAPVLIVSVPYRWRKGACKYHIHDPVDEAKMLSWFGREPVYSYVASELSGVQRLIQVYGPSELGGKVRQVPVPVRPPAAKATPAGKPKAATVPKAVAVAKPKAPPKAVAKVKAVPAKPAPAPKPPPTPTPTLTVRAKRFAKRVLRKLHLMPPAPLKPAAASAKPVATPAKPATPALAQAPLATRLPDPLLLYPLGYLVGRGGGRAPAHFRAAQFALPLWVHPRTRVGLAQDASGAVAVIGEALDPQAPERDHQAVAQAVLAAGADRQAVIDRLIGRFVVIAAPSGGEPEIQTDAIGLRSAYFARSGGGIVAGSHAALVAEGAFALSPPAVEQPAKWGYPGIDTPHEGVSRLPANIALSLRDGQLRRFFPVAEIPSTTLDDAWAFAFDQAGRALDALGRRTPVLVSLTGGMDTRCTLAAARPAWPRLRFFTYIDRRAEIRARHQIDSAIAADLAHTLGLQHESIVFDVRDPDPLLNEVLSANAFYHHRRPLAVAYLRQFGAHPWVHARTNMLELGRSNLYAKGHKIAAFEHGPRDAQVMARYYASRIKLSHSRHVLPAFERYVASCDVAGALRFASPWDLYFVEHRMGAWQANVCAESDVAFDTVIAFNSREIVRRFMGVPQEVRSTSAHLRERLAQMLPEVAQVPINPDAYQRTTPAR
jgi:hypothetical protein